MVLLSLFLGLTTFIAVTTVAYSMGIDKYIDSAYPNDFVLTDQTLVVGSVSQQQQLPFDDRFMGQVATLPGLESCTTLMREYMQLGYSPEEFGEHTANRLKALNDGKETFTEADIRKSFIGFLVGIDSADLRKRESG